jgi:hypothetical protein
MKTRNKKTWREEDFQKKKSLKMKIRKKKTCREQDFEKKKNIKFIFSEHF